MINMSMNHKVNNVQRLHESATTLYKNVVTGEGSSADSILTNLNSGIENLKKNWKGVDAGKRIQEVIRVYNAMVSVRNALAQLAVDSSSIASNYRNIQNANGAGLESLSVLAFDAKTNLSDYSDTTDTVDINPEAEAGKTSIINARDTMDPFISAVTAKYNEIMENWTAGTGRDNAQSAFDSFVSNANVYKQTLTDVSSNITTALQNYSS